MKRVQVGELPCQTMDPEVSLLLLCPLGGLSQERVAVELSPVYDRRPLPGGDKTITAIWETRLQAQPWIFDAPKFRLHSATLVSSSPEPHLLLHLGLTSYRDFLGTNWSSSASGLRQQGAADWGDKQAYLADPLGVGAALVTADDFIVFLRRSQQVAEAPGLVDVPGGHPEPQALCSGGIPQHKDLPGELVVRELFSSVLQEICDEVNLPLHTLGQPLLLGIACNETSAGRASAEFYVQCSLTSEEVRSYYLSGGPEAHESTGIIFVETQRVQRLQETEMWAQLCPSAKGAILLYNRHPLLQSGTGNGGDRGAIWMLVRRNEVGRGNLPFPLRWNFPVLPRSVPNNYYELLGVHPGASAEEVKRAFFTKSKELHPDRDPGNPALHSRFVELNEAYRVLSRAESRRNYDHQLHSASPPKSSGSTAEPGCTQQTHSSSWEPPNAQYWAQFHSVRPQGPESRKQQHKHNQRVLGYCLLLMVAGMGLHYVAFRKLEQVHRSFMDEKDRIITAIYNDTRARARAKRARIQQERQQRHQPGTEPSLSPESPRIMPQDTSP